MQVDIDETPFGKSQNRPVESFTGPDRETLWRIYSEIDSLEKTEAKLNKFAFVEEDYGSPTLPGVWAFCWKLLLGQTVWRKLP